MVLATHVNSRTIARDLTLLTEVDVEDFAPPEEVLEVWKSLGSKTKPPQMRLFEALDQAVKNLTEQRRRIYDHMTVHLGIERVVGAFGAMVDRNSMRHTGCHHLRG